MSVTSILETDSKSAAVTIGYKRCIREFTGNPRLRVPFWHSPEGQELSRASPFRHPTLSQLTLDGTSGIFFTSQFSQRSSGVA